MLIEIDAISKAILTKKKDTKLIKNIALQDQMKKLYKALKAKGIASSKWAYNRNEIASVRPLIDNITKEFINLEGKDEYTKLKELLLQQQKKAQRQYGGSNNYKDNKLKDLNVRLGNAILGELREYDKNLAEARNKSTFMHSRAGRKNINEKAAARVIEKRLLNKAFYHLKSSVRKEKQNYLNELEYARLEFELGTDLEI